MENNNRKDISGKKIWAKLSKNEYGNYVLKLLVIADENIKPIFADTKEEPRECRFINDILCIFNRKSGTFTPFRETDCIRPEFFKIWEYSGKMPAKTDRIAEEIDLIDPICCDFTDFSGENAVETGGYGIPRNKPVLTGKF